MPKLKKAKHKQRNQPTSANEIPVLFATDMVPPTPDVDDDTPIHRVNLGSGWVIGFTGLRGMGKSLGMAYIIAMALQAGLRVWSNMNVKYKCIYGLRKAAVFETEPLDWKAVYALSQDIRDGAVAIDELQYYLDSRTSLTKRNRILNAVIYQVRKRKLDFYFTVKDRYWLDKRLRNWEMDIEIACWDNSMYYPNLEKGTNFTWRIYDRSGTWTGKPCFDGSKATLTQTFTKGKDIWPIYNTEAIIDYQDQFFELEMEKTRMKIGDGDGYSEDEYAAMCYKILESSKTPLNRSEVFASAGINRNDVKAKIAAKLAADYGVEIYPSTGTMKMRIVV